ncbi:MAG: RES domain-containing protein [Pyrinomonadaceae bacterium]|nr:RES domain-containing protein [Pyrinomonadaceae bacterium]
MRLTAYRIFKSNRSQNWSDGEGSYLFGGRWNSRGTRILYTASSLSLAALEMLVHLEQQSILFSYSFAALTFDDKFVLPVSDVSALPDNWSSSPAPRDLQKIGDRWAASKISVVLKVPSAVIPLESNYLVNVDHPKFPTLFLGEPQDFMFDQRLK